MSIPLWSSLRRHAVRRGVSKITLRWQWKMKGLVALSTFGETRWFTLMTCLKGCGISFLLLRLDSCEWLTTQQSDQYVPLPSSDSCQRSKWLQTSRLKQVSLCQTLLKTLDSLSRKFSTRKTQEHALSLEEEKLLVSKELHTISLIKSAWNSTRKLVMVWLALTTPQSFLHGLQMVLFQSESFTTIS